MSRGKRHIVATGVVEMFNGVNSVVVAVGESDPENDESPVLHMLTACVSMRTAHVAANSGKQLNG